MTFKKEDLIKTARQVALNQGVDPALFCALCEHESGGWVWCAFRYEPGFYTRYVVPLGLKSNTEANARATSWGLGQVMGQVARELGFTGKYLSELLDPEIGCYYACKKLKQCLEKEPTVEKALLRYNGGGIPNYPLLVLQHYNNYGGRIE